MWWQHNGLLEKDSEQGQIPRNARFGPRKPRLEKDSEQGQIPRCVAQQYLLELLAEDSERGKISRGQKLINKVGFSAFRLSILFVHSRIQPPINKISFHVLYKTRPCSHPILAKKKHQKQGFSGIFQLYARSFLSFFEYSPCILHHFAFLVGAQLVIFSTPKTCI